MRDPKVVVELVHRLVPVVFSILLAPVSISLFITDSVLVPTPGTMDPCVVGSLDRLFVVIWMTFICTLLAITMSNVASVRDPPHSRWHAVGAWILLACARVFSIIAVFFTVEIKWKRYTCLSMEIRLIMGTTMILALLSVLYDSYVCLMEDSPPSASADTVRTAREAVHGSLAHAIHGSSAHAVHGSSAHAVPDSVSLPLYRYVLEGRRLEEYAKEEERKRKRAKATVK